MIAVRDHLDELAPASVVVVTFATPERLSAYRRHLRLPFPILADTDRAFYRAYGLARASLRRVYSWATICQYIRLIARGRRLRRPTEDTKQLGGDFVIDATGRIAFAYRSAGPHDRPDIATLIATVRAAP